MGKASLQLTMLLCLGGGMYGVILLVLGIRPRHLKAGQQQD
jgi:putative peptidoglycan lipid II flippase